MSLLDRYLIREYLRALAGVAFILAVLMLVSIIIEHFDDVYERGVSAGVAFQWFLLLLPRRLVQAIPVIVLLAVLFSMGNLARHSEIQAMVGAGLSRARIFLPLLGVTGVLVVAMLLFSETVVPMASAAARYTERVRIEHKPPPTEMREISLRGAGDTHYWMEAYLDYANRQRMISPVILRLSPDRRRVVERIDARWATHVRPNRPGSEPFWRFSGGGRWVFDEKDGHLLSFESFRERRVDLEDDLTEFLSVRKKPEEMNFFELRHFIGVMGRRSGVDLDQYLTELHLKIAFPFALIVVAALAFPFALKTSPRHLFVGFSLGVFWLMAFYVFVGVLRSLGHEGHLWPWFAAWAPNVVFAVAAIYFMMGSERG